MSEFSNKFKKFDGFNLVFLWFKSGVLHYAIFWLLILGFSKKRLEILRLLIRDKIYRKLKKKYVKYINKSSYSNLESLGSNKVWVCWYQGIENAPEIVKVCYSSLVNNLKDKEIVLLTEKNINSFVQIPEFILEKRRKGIISDTHFSDILRVELLIKHGGAWVDATVLCTGSHFPKSFFESDLFLFQNLKPGKDGHSLNISSWFIAAKSNNKVLLHTRELLHEYWKNKNYLVDYFLFHYFVQIVLDELPREYNKIPCAPNSTPHILLFELFHEFEEERFSHISNMTSFHKLSYKFDDTLKDKEHTNYQKLLNSNKDNA